jgi:hypothetical protein
MARGNEERVEPIEESICRRAPSNDRVIVLTSATDRRVSARGMKDMTNEIGLGQNPSFKQLAHASKR